MNALHSRNHAQRNSAMTHLTLISESPLQLQPLIQTALAHEMGMLEVSIRQSQHRLHAFELRFAMPTAEFLARYESDQFEETLDFAEWIGEFRLLERLREKMLAFLQRGKPQ